MPEKRSSQPASAVVLIVERGSRLVGRRVGFDDPAGGTGESWVCNSGPVTVMHTEPESRRLPGGYQGAFAAPEEPPRGGVLIAGGRHDHVGTGGGTSATMDRPTAVQAIRQLEPLAGEWTFEGAWPVGEPWLGGRTVTLQWHASGRDLVERGPNELPEAPDDISLIPTDGRQP